MSPASDLHMAQIKLLMVAKPVVLFKKLNRLDWYAGALHHWSGSLPLGSADTILEVGCATGAHSEHLAAAGHSVTGIDASKKMIKAARANRHHRAIYQQASVLALPFADGHFDGVISASLLNIVPERERAIAEMVRVCKPGGFVSCLVPALGFDDENLRQLGDAIGATGFSAAALWSWHHYAPKMAVADVVALCAKAGLERPQLQQPLGGMLLSITATKGAVASRDR